jgi:VIT1/CCC1 family predicted Fe2+/Mn2+ transporter
MVPVFLFELSTAIMISVIWGLLALTFLSYIITSGEKENAWKVIMEHLVIALIVISITHYVGDWVSIALAS